VHHAIIAHSRRWLGPWTWTRMGLHAEMLVRVEASQCGCSAGTRSRWLRCIRRGKGRRIPPVTAGENRTRVRLMRLLSPPSIHCEYPTGPTVELRSNVHGHGTWGRASAAGGASRYCHWRRDAML
jgi:hypothetical protein